ncbi:MAG: transglycosylase SLT domain-containing protein [Thermostichales cyanobacterium SRBZ-1_bins_19]
MGKGWGKGSWVLSLVTLVAGGLGAGLCYGQQGLSPELLMDVAPGESRLQGAVPRLAQAWQALQARQGGQALQHLQGLEQHYPLLADQIVMMRAQAYEQTLNATKAAETWAALISGYPQSPLVARALLGLKRYQEILDRYPHHPQAIPALLALLQQNPQNWSAIRALALHHPQTPNLIPHLQRWHASGSLTVQDWGILGDAYWEQRDYGRAARAFANAELTPRNLYRRARSHELSREIATAQTLYRQFLQQFPGDELMPLTRERLAATLPVGEAAAVLQELARQNHPGAPRATQLLINLYSRNNSPVAAQQWQDYLWTTFPSSEAAAITAWPVVWEAAQRGDLNTAIALARRIAHAQTNNEEGAQLGFWAGKWLAQQGNREAALQEYRRVLLNAPRTYHAWRSAHKLGLAVGDFRASRTPVTVNTTPAILPLPGVSPQVQALYESGIPKAAWERWQWEVNIHGKLTPSQQFVTGLLRNAAGDHLRGINQVGELRWVDHDNPEVQQLRLRPDFWQAIYPLHYYHAGLATYAEEFNLNPLLVTALIRQESRFEPEIRSSAGATGLMQVMPATGAWIAGKMGVRDFQLTNPRDNLRFGIWYLDYTHRTYNNNSILAIASYNAGPGNVSNWLKRFGFGDPDVFIEQIPFGETRHYVKAVFGNFWNYSRLYNPATIAALEQANLLSMN